MQEVSECTRQIQKITLSEAQKKFSPAKWEYVMSNVEKAYTTDTPCLVHLEQAHGTDGMVYWVKGQILALFGSSASDDKGIADGISLFASSFASQVKGYKLTELMLFFARYKAGKYDNSFTKFDARRIGNAFFKEFIPERNRELDRINNKRIQEEIENRRFIPPKGYTSLSWYQELKKRAENGDIEAENLLKNKR